MPDWLYYAVWAIFVLFQVWMIAILNSWRHPYVQPNGFGIFMLVIWVIFTPLWLSYVVFS